MLLVRWSSMIALGVATVAASGCDDECADEVGAWVSMTSVGGPLQADALFPHMVWTGRYAVVWPGDAPGARRYDPEANEWSPVAVEGAPSGGLSPVWTGTELILWGGDQFVLQGGRYDPEQDAWLPMSLDGAPSVRGAPGVVWTGSALLVWGGVDAEGYPVGGGGRYDPEADAWSPISEQGAPSTRRSPLVLWLGDRMLVAGGVELVGDAAVTVFDAHSYDPVGDSWEAVPYPDEVPLSSGVPAVWTGDELLVMPLEIDSGPPATEVLRFRPGDTEWRTGDTCGAPASFFGSAVWTGTEMIAWGGIVFNGRGDGYSDEGGLYDPVADHWRQTSSELAPPGRWVHAAIWTGTEMIVWGGLDDDGVRDDGRRFVPAQP